jgi:ribonuclease HI
MQFYYAVVRGRTPGIYTSLSECHEQVDGFPDALHKIFMTLENAETFYKQKPKKTKPTFKSSVKPTPSKHYYVVASGRTTGIFSSSTECDAQVCGVPNALSKSFKNLDEAKLFYDMNKSRQSLFNHVQQPNLFSDENSVTVYTDGSFFEGDEETPAHGGIGIWFGDNDSRNTSEKFKGNNPTSSKMELFAIIRALEIIPDSISTVKIFTDCMYAIIYLTIPKDRLEIRRRYVLRANKHRSSGCEPFIEEAKKLISLRKKVIFKHVRAHSGIYGNHQADSLAKNGSNNNNQSK